MDYDVACASIRALVEAGYNETPIVWQGDTFEPEKEAKDGWLYVEIGSTLGEAETFGHPTTIEYRDDFKIMVFLFVPRGQLPGAVEARAARVRLLFRPSTMPDFTITERTIHVGEPAGKNSRWYGVPIEIKAHCIRVEPR